MKKIYYLLAFAVLALSACQKEPALQQVTVIPPLKETLTLTLQTSDYQSLASGYPKSTFTIDNNADAAIYVPQIMNKEYSNVADGSTATVTYAQSALYWKSNADSVYADAYYALTAADYLLLPNNTYTDFSIAQVESWLTYKYPSPTANELKLLKFTPYPATLTPAPPLSFMYYNNKWINIYTVSPAQYTSAGLGQYDEFTTAWTETALNGAFNTFMKSDPTLMDTIKKNDIVFVSFNYYVSSKADYQRVKPLQFDGNNFVAPYTTTATIDLVKTSGSWGVATTAAGVNHTLNAADETLIANSSVGGTALASYRGYVSKYGDFDVGTGEWTLPLLDQAFILVLQADYPTPTANIPYNITYNVYTNSVDVPTVATFTWNGTTWIASQ
jgi:hypothetical protein